MDSSSSWEQQSDSEDGQEQPDSDTQGPVQGSSSQSRRADKTELGTQQAVATLEGTLPSRGRLLNESDPVFESSERKPGQRQSRASEKSGQRNSCKSKGIQSRSPESRRKEVKRHLSTAYRDLLNVDIEDARRRSSGRLPSLGSSQVGASHWTSHEKDNLFRRIEHSGSGDLLPLCQAVPTKSAAEIKAYLLLLDEKISGPSSEATSAEEFHMIDVPAACEISFDCESGLNAAADALECRVHDADVKAEQLACGDEWLIDEQAADQIELEYENSPEEQGNAEGDLDSAPLTDQTEPASLNAATKPECLLRPAAFLELSSNLFMNNGEDEEQNWHHLDALSTDTEGPAMFRSALADLHDLTISLTRRLVQVIIFQTLSRLRAEDTSRADWTPSAIVRDADVGAALDMVNMSRSAKEYWISCPRRCKVDVYSDSKKFADGRPGTKQGRQLSYNEVEAELGLESLDSYNDTKQDEHIDAEEIKEALYDDELFTDVSDATDHADNEAENIERARTTRRRPRKRKRALSPEEFCRVETSYLEAADRNASAAEEKRVRRMIRMEALVDAEISRSRLPLEPGPVPNALISDIRWRHRAEFDAEWEQPQEVVRLGEFHQMELAGEAGRRRRKLLVAEVQRRIHERSTLPSEDDDEYASDERGETEDEDESEDEASAEHSNETPSDDGIASKDKVQVQSNYDEDATSGE